MKKLTNNSFSQQKGFTLIELVVVIVILGILAATAAPKFLDLTGDARESVMKGVQGSINSSISLVHAKALVGGQIGATGEIIIGSESYALVYGYPAAAGVGDDDGTTTNGFGIEKQIDLDNDSEITFADGVFTHSGAPSDGDACILTYAEATDSETPPTVTSTLTGC